MPRNNYIFLSFLAITIFAFISCTHKPNDRVGCTDRHAVNYDLKATIGDTCRYNPQCEDTNKQYEGAYCVQDTFVSFQHDMTHGWFDTTTAGYVINVKAVKSDSLAFDNILTMQAIAPAGFRFYDNCSHFSYNNGYYPYALSGSGRFTGDTLRYSEGLTPMPTSGGYVARWGTGIRYAK